MSKSNRCLDNLVNMGHIVSYEYVDVDEDGIVGIKGHYRNSEKLILRFSKEYQITIESFCSGSSENTVLFISEGE
jgi:hypothetical protein